jgi:hypothetical protein
MKKLDLSPIAVGISMYPKAGTFQFLQLAYQEILSEIIIDRIGSSYNSSNVYILNGCVNSGSGSNYIISAGSIFYNGEVYLVPSSTFTISGSNVAIGVLTTTQYLINADPTDFSDGIQRNVHNIRSIVFQSGASGSGVANFSSLITLTDLIQTGSNAILNTINSLTINGGSGTLTIPNGATLQQTGAFLLNLIAGANVNVTFPSGTGTLAYLEAAINTWQGTNTFKNSYNTSSTPSISAGSAAGTSPTINIYGTNQDGYITILIGTSPTIYNTVATITMSGGFSYPNKATPILQAGNGAANTAMNLIYITAGNSGWTINVNITALTVGNTYLFHYHCGGY